MKTLKGEERDKIKIKIKINGSPQNQAKTLKQRTPLPSILSPGSPETLTSIIPLYKRRIVGTWTRYNIQEHQFAGNDFQFHSTNARCD